MTGRFSLLPSLKYRRHLFSSSYRESFAPFIDQSSIDNSDKYLTDWTQQYRGGSLILKPKTIENISYILDICYRDRINVVTQGGNTGLVGGGVGINNEVILSLEKMNKIIDIDIVSGVAIVEAGCILETLTQGVAKYGYIVPWDLGAKGSCQIGGNVATNAGGLRMVKYGSMHQNILGLEVVQSNGVVLNMLRTLQKDNTGYHLKNIFIGSEGTLGIITKVAIKLQPMPTSTQVALLKVCTLLMFI